MARKARVNGRTGCRTTVPCRTASSPLPRTRALGPVLSALVFFSSAAPTLVSMSTVIFMANQTPPELRGRASGWSQAGNLGGTGIGGGIGLALAEHIPHPWVSGAALPAICFACWGGMLFLPQLVRTGETL